MVVTLCGRSHSNRMASTGKNNVLEVRYSFALGARLRKLRHQLGLSQEEVAHRAGIATYTYQKFENGERGIETASLAVALRIADFLGVHPRELI